MGSNNLIFLENIEWFDETGTEMVHRVPESGSGEIKWGAQLTVRESQAAVLFYQGRARDAYGPGRQTLHTGNIPILTKVLSIPWAMSSPLRAEVYFANLKVFPSLKWGTKDPVAFRDSELGLIRLRAFGVFDIRIIQPVLFINSLVGTKRAFSTREIDEYLSQVIVSRLNDLLGEQLDTLINLPGKYDELSEGLKKKLREDFSHYGLALMNLYINAITPPLEVQQAIDDKSRLGLFNDLDKLVKMKAAMALEKAVENQGEAAAMTGMGLGVMMPAMFARSLGLSNAEPAEKMSPCPDCGLPAPPESRFCPHCGHQILVFQQCESCGKNLPPQAKFCTRCGKKVEDAVQARTCGHCGAENLPTSVFCNNCGDKL
ncbi:MAG: SPFH domain-containing protein [Pseudomonadota bacterium]